MSNIEANSTHGSCLGKSISSVSAFFTAFREHFKGKYFLLVFAVVLCRACIFVKIASPLRCVLRRCKRVARLSDPLGKEGHAREVEGLKFLSNERDKAFDTLEITLVRFVSEGSVASSDVVVLRKCDVHFIFGNMIEICINFTL